MVGCCSWLGIPQLILSHDSHFHSAGTRLLPSLPVLPLPPLLCLPRSLLVWRRGGQVCLVVQPLLHPCLLVAVALVAGSRPWRHPQPGSGGSEAGRAEMAAR